MPGVAVFGAAGRADLNEPEAEGPRQAPGVVLNGGVYPGRQALADREQMELHALKRFGASRLDAPELFQLIIGAGLGLHDMDDNIAEVNQRPFPLVFALHP